MNEDMSVSAAVDAQGIITAWSARARELLGHEAREVVGETAEALLVDDLPEAARQGCAGHTAWEAELLLRHRGGQPVRRNVRAQPLLDGLGGAHWILTSPDEPGLEKVKAWTLEQLPVSNVLFNRGRLLVAANLATKGVGGRTEEQLLGLQPGEVAPGQIMKGAENLDRVIDQVFATGVPAPLNTDLRPGGESQHVWQVVVTPVQDPAGKVQAVSVTTLDTTEQYRARRRMAALNEASLHVGSTLEIGRTAEEMAEFAVARIADFVTVELLEPVPSGGEAAPPAPGSTLVFRRAAQQSVLEGCPESVVPVGGTHAYEADGAVGAVLTAGRAVRFDPGDESSRWWTESMPERARNIREHGIHSMILAPLRARGVTLGFLVLCRHRTEVPFDENDRMLVEELAARSALFVDNARRYTHERATALALQHSLLPRRAPRQQAVEVASRYVPNTSTAGVGGDWFDVIPLSGARVALVVGDVVGRGIQASATMARLRAAVWTLADVDLAPDELLTHLDDLVLRLDQEETAHPWDSAGAIGGGCVYAVYDPVAGRCEMARAGHPEPVLVKPDGTADFLDLPAGPPLGLGGLPFEAMECELPAGSTLAFYTNGLVEPTAGRDLDTALALLRDTLARSGPSLEETCDTVVDTLRPDRPTDDIALLLGRTHRLDSESYASWDLPADPASVPDARRYVQEKLAAWGVDEAAFVTELVASELVTNAIRYGAEPISLRLIRDTSLICEVTDASSTAPHLRRARVLDEDGRGLLLVAQLTDRWGARYHRDGKTIWAEQPLP